MIPAHSSSLKGAVLKIRKIVPRLDFSSRAISVRSFPAAYSCMTRTCRGEIPARYAFTLFRRRAFATGGMIDWRTLNATSSSFSPNLRRRRDHFPLCCDLVAGPQFVIDRRRRQACAFPRRVDLYASHMHPDEPQSGGLPSRRHEARPCFLDRQPK